MGDGKSIDIRNDNWGFEGLNGDSLHHSLLSDNERVVKDLWNHNRSDWNKKRVIELFRRMVGDQICNLPISDNGINDRRVWIHNPHGFYTFKSAYS